MPRFANAARDAVTRVSLSQLRDVADRIEKGWPADAVTWALGGDASAVAAILHAKAADSLPAATAAAYLRGAVDGYELGVGIQSVDVVWSGPATSVVPVRSTARLIIELIDEAQRELVLVTYSARQYQPVLDVLRAAISRQVQVDIVVETLAGAGSALSGQEPAAAFVAVPGVRLWHWPVDARPIKGSKMHAKIAVADRRLQFASSVNLTQSGVESSIEAGVLVRGGSSPGRTHLRQLQSQGVLRPLA